MKVNKLCLLSRLVVVLIMVSLLLGIAPSPAAQATEKPYYEGKTIQIIVASGVGGGDDMWGRLIAMYLRTHIPGNPSIVVRNIPAGGGLVGCNLAWASKPNGLTLLVVGGTEVLNSILRPKGIEYDLKEGHPVYSEGNGVVLYSKPSMVKEPKDIITTKGLIFGHTGSTGGIGAMFVWSKEIMEFPTEKVIWGYKGSGDAWLAFLHGEVNFSGGATVSYNTIVKSFVERGEAIPIFQSGLIDAKGDIVKEASVPNVPTIKELYQQIFGKPPSGIAWDVCVMQIGIRTVGKCLVLPPQTPKDCVELLSKAAVAMVKDPEFVEKAEKANSGATRIVAENLIAAYRYAFSVRPEVIDHMKKVYTEKYNLVFN